MRAIGFTLLLGALLSGRASAETPPAFSALDGTWLTDCVSETESGQQLYSTHAVAFTGQAFEFTIKENRAAGCANLAVTVVYGGTYTLPGPGTDSGSPVNLAYTHSTMTPASRLIASFMNAQQTCGISDWAAGVAHDVNGRTCNGQKVPANGSTIYELFLIDPTGFMLGDLLNGDDGSDEAHRPTQVDSTVLYKKQ